MSKRKGGWYGESERHSLARRGVPTGKGVYAVEERRKMEERKIRLSDEYPLTVLEEVTDSVMERTIDAYSRDYYSEREWRRIARWLLEQDYTEEDTVIIMLSKHMRWAADMHDGVRMTLAKFQAYYNHPGWNVKADIEKMLAF